MRWILLFLMLAFTTPALACGRCGNDIPFLRHVTLTDPVTYRLVHTGITGLILDEYVRVISNKWRDDITDYQLYGILSYDVLREQIRLSERLELDYRSHRYSDKRYRWWHYYTDIPPAPNYTSGPSADVINVGPFRVDRKFQFKLKQYQAHISNDWRFKFKPNVSFSMQLPILERISTGFEFTYKVAGRSVFKATLGVAVKLRKELKRSSGELSLMFELPIWGNIRRRYRYIIKPPEPPETAPIPRIFEQQLVEALLCCNGPLQPHQHRGE